MRCQCDRTAFDHTPGRCPATWGLIRVERNGTEMWVCVNCIFTVDVKLDPDPEDD